MPALRATSLPGPRGDRYGTLSDIGQTLHIEGLCEIVAPPPRKDETDAILLRRAA